MAFDIVQSDTNTTVTMPNMAWLACLGVLAFILIKD